MLKSSQEPSKTLLQPGCRWESFWGAFWDPRNLENRALACSAVLFSAKIADCARGSKIEAKCFPGAVLVALKAVSKRATISGPNFNQNFMNFYVPRGGRGRGPPMAFKSVLKIGSRREQVSNGRWTLSGTILGTFWPPKTTPFRPSLALVFAKRFCLECTTAAGVHFKHNNQEAGRAWNA